MPTYDPPNEPYTTSIPAGTRAFREEVKAHYGFTRTEVVRDQSRCAQTPSEHCCCRAIDFFTTDLAFGRRVFEWAVRQGDALGVQSVIFNRRVWGFGNWTERSYNGPSPHTDHVHIGLNKAASKTLTRQMVRATWATPPQPPTQEDDDVLYIKRIGSVSNAVYRVGPVLEHVDGAEWAALPDPKPTVIEVAADSPLYLRPKLLAAGFDPDAR